MRETYTQEEAARALGIKRRTLFNWLQEAGLGKGTWPGQRRTKLTRAEVEQLARDHKRVVQDVEVLRDPLREIAQLREQIAHLEARQLTQEGRIQALENLLGARLFPDINTDKEER